MTNNLTKLESICLYNYFDDLNENKIEKKYFSNIVKKSMKNAEQKLVSPCKTYNKDNFEFDNPIQVD
jgi:hypothetical protein